jgi:hypothetical protein
MRSTGDVEVDSLAMASARMSAKFQRCARWSTDAHSSFLVKGADGDAYLTLLDQHNMLR